MPWQFDISGFSRQMQGQGDALVDLIKQHAVTSARAGRSKSLLEGMRLLSEAVGDAGEKRRRKKQWEEEIASRKSETEQAREDRLAQERRGVDRDLMGENVKVEAEKLKRDQEKREKEEAKAANLPKIQSINAKFKAAITAKDDNAFADALEEYSYLDEDFQKLVPLAAHQKRFDKVMEPPKEDKKLSPSDQLAQMKMEKIAKLQEVYSAFGTGKASKEELQQAYVDAAMFDPSAFDKIPDFMGIGDGTGGPEPLGTGKDAMPPDTMVGLDKEQGAFSGLSDQKAVNPRVLTQMAIARDLGIEVDSAAIMSQPGAMVPVTAGARISKRKFAAVMEADNAIESGVYGEGKEKDDPMVWRQALDDAYENNGIPVEKPTGIKRSVIDQITNGGTSPEDFEEAIDPEAIRKELEIKYPDLYDLLRDDEDFAAAIDKKYGVDGLADYLSLNQVSNAF